MPSVAFAMLIPPLPLRTILAPSGDQAGSLVMDPRPRAPRWQRGGQEFDPRRLHLVFVGSWLAWIEVVYQIRTGTFFGAFLYALQAALLSLVSVRVRTTAARDSMPRRMSSGSANEKLSRMQFFPSPPA